MNYADIVRDVEQAAGKAVLDRAAHLHDGDLPIRHSTTGQIVAYVPRSVAAGLCPVVLNGLVVGYYRDTDRGRAHVMFTLGIVRFSHCEPGEEWAVEPHEGGITSSAYLVRRAPAR